MDSRLNKKAHSFFSRRTNFDKENRHKSPKLLANVQKKFERIVNQKEVHLEKFTLQQEFRLNEFKENFDDYRKEVGEFQEVSNQLNELEDQIADVSQLLMVTFL